MISANQYKLTWEHFDDINSNKRIAFENLCRSLFYRTKVSSEEVLHSNPNHPGVEVAPVLANDGKTMISFQAKYFDDDIKYEQIKKSMEKAVSYYRGELQKIYLYCNRDITTTSQSYQSIEKLVGSARIELVLVTGQSILDEAMKYPSILANYFGIDSLDKSWFVRNLHSSLDNLGKRYNARFNIDTEAQRQLSVFLKNDECVEILNKKKSDLIEVLTNLRWHCDGQYNEIRYRFIEAINKIKDLTKYTINEVFKWKEHIENIVSEDIDKLKENKIIVQKKLADEKLGTEVYNKLRSELYVIDQLYEGLDLIKVSDREKQLLSGRSIVVKGNMGTGKSQLLATSAVKESSNGRLALLLLGQTFIFEESIENQIMKGLIGIDSSESFESLLGVMDEQAYENGELSIIYIDAINESRDRDIWKEGINHFISEIEQFDNILLVISLRSGFEPLLFPEKVEEDLKNGKIVSIIHNGFIDESPKAVFDFLSYSGIPASPEFFLQQEMTNPLFLTWFCQTYSGEEKGVISLISSVLEQADKEASKDAGYKEPLGLLKYLLMDYIEHSSSEAVTKRTLLGLDAWELYGITNKIAYLKAIERAGILASYVRNGKEHYYIGYNLLEDYVSAQYVIEKHKDKQSIRQYCLRDLLGVDSDGKISRFGNESIFVMITALYSIEFGEECVDIIDEFNDEGDKDYIIDDYVKTFTWRTPHFTFNQFIDMINKYQVNTRTLWSVFIENSTKQESILNADGLTVLLKKYSIRKRDYLWTIDINELTENDRIISLAYYLEEGNSLSGLSNKRIELLITLYAWMLSSSNRVLRDRVSKAMVEVLKVHFSLCRVLLEKFISINDPYIIQRLVGIIFGAVTKRVQPFEVEFEQLASMVYYEIFAKDKIFPDILLRDYARLIIERFLYEYPNKRNLIDLERIKPPYASEPIPQIEVIDYDDGKYHENGVWRLLYSMKFDLDVKGPGMYGDFGRYIFQSALHDFKNVDEHNVYYYAMEFILHELGYSNELFGSFDTNRADFDRDDRRKIERIGKKYEWISMYNILARLSDRYNVIEYDLNGVDEKVFKGPWNPYVRDFDPTLNDKYKVEVSVFPFFEEELKKDNHFINIESKDEEINKWIRDDDDIYNDFPRRFIRKDKNGIEWLSMYLYQEIKQTVPRTENSLSITRGEQHIWAISSMHIAEDDQDISLDKLQQSRYLRKNSGMNATTECHTLFSREYAWSTGYFSECNNINSEYDECEVKAHPAVIHTMWECQYDASKDETISYYIPDGMIIQALGLQQKQYDGVFYYKDEIAAFDTSIIGCQHGELLIRKDLIDLFLNKSKTKIFWNIVGEKQFFLDNHGQKWQRREGYFIYNYEGIEGAIDNVPND